MRNNARHSQIGLDRVVRLSWLERTASLVSAGDDAQAIKHELQQELAPAFRSQNVEVRGSLDKTLTILLKIWVKPPVDLEAFKADGLRLISNIPPELHIAVHWGMIAAVYPFWASVASQVGRLLRLQGTATAAQVQRRMKEQYGERETVARRTRYLLRSFLDWRVIQEQKVKGVYVQGSRQKLDTPQLVAWLVEACLHSKPGGMGSSQELFQDPSLFPFGIRSMSASKLESITSRIESTRHGLDQNILVLRRDPRKQQ